MVYIVCVIWWSYCLGPTHQTHVCGKGERDASRGHECSSCFVNGHHGWARRARGHHGLEEGSRAKTIGRGKSKEMLIGCSPHSVMMVEPGSCAQAYTVYGGKAKLGQASEWVSELSMLLGGGGEHLGIPSYRLGKWGYATSLLARL
jgi:hypothetical protein